MKYIFYIAMLLIVGLVSLDYWQHEIVPKAEAHPQYGTANSNDMRAHKQRHDIIEKLEDIEKQNKDIIKLLEDIKKNTK